MGVAREPRKVAVLISRDLWEHRWRCNRIWEQEGLGDYSGLQHPLPSSGHAIGLRVIRCCPVAFEAEDLTEPRKKENSNCIPWLMIITTGTAKRGIHSPHRVTVQDCTKMFFKGIASTHRVNLSMIVRQYLKPYQPRKRPIMSRWIMWKRLVDIIEGQIHVS